mgnify:CR=1 FL=1
MSLYNWMNRPIPSIVAMAAMTLACFRMNIKVGRRIGMTLRAVSLGLLFTSQKTTRVATLGIDAASHGFKMAWITTRRGTAKMVGFKPFWDWAFQLFIDRSVNQGQTALNRSAAITQWCTVTHPQPTWAKFWMMERHRSMFVNL